MKTSFASIATVLLIAGQISFAQEQQRSEGASELRRLDAPQTSSEPETVAGAEWIGRSISDFALRKVDGETSSLDQQLQQSDAIAVVFMSVDCPIGNAYIPTLNELSDTLESENVSLIGIYANSGVKTNQILHHQTQYGIRFPVFMDEQQVSLEHLGATRTPDVYVLDNERIVRYRGRIDNRFGYTFKQDEPDRDDLAEAIEQVLAGEDVSVPVTETLGCLITKRERASTGEISFTSQIDQIVRDNCQICHHPGAAAPFSLVSYDDVADHAEMIKEVVLERRMPPWHADPRFGEFSNDLRMAQTDIDTLIQWVDMGTPLGDEQDSLAASEFVNDWMIDQPDLIFDMPETYTVQADGVVEYQYFRMPSGIEEDIWIRAAEARPGNRSVVHHIILYYIDRDAEDGRRRKSIVGTAPGDEPLVLPPDMGIRIPAGVELLWEMHYTPIGREQTDRSQVGLVLCKEPPKHEVRGDMVIKHDFAIPPGHANFEVAASTTIHRDVQLIELMPHMHVRGKDFLYRAIYPDNTDEILLSVPNYDFNWQHTYRLAEPKFIPSGTRIECIAHYDNSDGNPANPDPTKTVTWGDQTFEEMMIGFMKYIVP